MKPKREITLGEMQDECKRVFGGCALCRVKNECAFCLDVQPAEVDLTDPPRFTEAQMAFWKGWYAIGARWVKRRTGTACVDFSLTTSDFCVSYSCVLSDEIANELKEGKAYDLAELFWKDCTE